MFERGKVILVPFPFTDLSSNKVRPAMIVSDPKTTQRDVIVVFVSSVIPNHPSKTEVLIPETNLDFSDTGLKVSSVVKCQKIATLDQRIVLGELGKISLAIQKDIDRAMKIAVGLK